MVVRVKVADLKALFLASLVASALFVGAVISIENGDAANAQPIPLFDADNNNNN